MQILRHTIHLHPEPLGAWVSQSRTASAQREPSWSHCMLPWSPLPAGQSKASLSAVVPLIAPSKVSLLARSRVVSCGLLAQATRLRGIQDAQRKTWPAGTRHERRTHHAMHAVGWAQGKVGAARPNPSFKRSANGRPPAPGRRYAVHFRHPGAGVLPPSSA